MIKVVNARDYDLGESQHGYFLDYWGFIMLNTETSEAYSFDGVYPYVLKKKKVMESCVSGEWYKTMKTVKAKLRT
jgi:hypothetical protein